MTLKEAKQEFMEVAMPLIEHRECGSPDYPLRRETWGVFTDSLHRDGRITSWQYENWGYPEFCEK